MLIDTHCHVLSSEYDNVNEIIDETFKSNIDKIIINGIDLKSSMEAVELALKYDNVYAAVGLGPESVIDVDEDTIKSIEKLCLNDKVVAIGEIGLDYYWTTETKEKQKYVFESMLKIAKEYNKPVIVHSRKSINDTYNLLKEYNVTGIMHCYSGSIEMAREFVKIGFLIGVGGVVTFKNAKEIKEVVSNIDLENIALETDSPYLAPEPFRGKQNKPMYVEEVAKKISEIKGITYDEVVQITGTSVVSKFDL